MGFFVSILFCLLTVTCLGQSTNKHMICKSVDDVFDDVASTGVSRRRHIGPPGKPGLPGNVGQRGLPGPKGPVGKVDYGRLEEIVRARVDEETREMENKFNEVSKQIQNMTKKLNQVNEQLQYIKLATCDGVIFDERCYWAEIHSTQDIDIAEAQKICRQKRSKLANIYSKYHYDMVMKYLISKLHGISYIHVWTGMRKIYQNRFARLSDNTQAPYTKARTYSPNWNDAGKDYTHVYLIAHEPSYTGSDQGMGAYIATWASRGALCQSK